VTIEALLNCSTNPKDTQTHHAFFALVGSAQVAGVCPFLKKGIWNSDKCQRNNHVCHRACLKIRHLITVDRDDFVSNIFFAVA
jgi:hypothetical protein